MQWENELFKDRAEDAAKGDFGSIGFVGGSAKYPNTPAICARSALHTGADLNVIVAPGRAADACTGFGMDLIVRKLDGERFRPEHVDTVAGAAEGLDCLVVGNGLGDEEETLAAVEQLVAETSVPLVLDGDALKADLRSMQLGDRKAVLTPHRGEFERIYMEPAEKPAALKEQAMKASRVLEATVVVKGPVDVAADGSETYANFTGNPYMTKGGTGDILAGICGALLPRTEPLRAGYLAAKVSGIAGDRAAERKKQSLELEDIVESMDEAFEAIRNQ